ncbi:heterokaryon incompatibility protein-domain-containing protein [Apiospora kogelbergensis]|uniref:heterokaryon incompatibility protein-domain-containing protein n=1 Tax=Apiospora kogelbergensis TaxID=1337665 RepID=UPI00312FDDE5
MLFAQLSSDGVYVGLAFLLFFFKLDDGEKGEEQKYFFFPVPARPAKPSRQHQRAASYQHTELGKNEIRLVKILPSSAAHAPDGIACTIQHALLDVGEPRSNKPPRYVALSYVWGNAEDTREIRLNRSAFLVTRNLHAALLRLRDDSVTSYLWIDAICINQRNDVEKAQQVARMAEIYANAEDVTFWLSTWPCTRIEDTDGKSTGRDLELERSQCRVCGVLAGLEDLALANFVRDIPTLDVDCLMDILRNAWFMRVWTLQECTIHQRGKIQIGSHSMPMDLFLDGTLKLWDALHLSRQLPEYRALESIASIRHQRTNLGNRKLSGSDYAETIMMLLQASSNRACSIPHDILYAVFGLMDSMHHSPNHLRPNYAKTFERVCHDYAVEIFTNSPYGLKLLGFARNELQGDVPSWVPDFRYIGDIALSLVDRDGATRLSSNNRQLLFEGANIGICVSSLGVVTQTTHWTDHELSNLDRLAERIVEFETKILFPAADISDLELEELLVNLLSAHLSPNADLEECIQAWLTLASWPSTWSNRETECQSRAELQTLLLGSKAAEPTYQALSTLLESGFLVLDSGAIGRAINKSTQARDGLHTGVW